MEDLDVIFRRIKSAIIAQLQAAGNDIVEGGFGFETPLALAHAAEFKSLQKYIEQIILQSTPLTADGNDSDIGMLDFFGEIKDIYRQSAAQGIYTCRLTFTRPTNIPANSLWVSNNGVRLTNAEQITGGGPTTATLVSEQTGKDGRLEMGDVVNLQIGLASLEKDSPVIEIVQNSSAKETDAAYRPRVIAAYNAKQLIGTKDDYRIWARMLPDVVEAYPYPSNMQHNIYFPEVYIETASNILSSQMRAAYLSILTQKAPIFGGEISIKACKRLPVEIILFNKFDVNPVEIFNVCTDYFSKIRPYISGSDLEDNSTADMDALRFLVWQNTKRQIQMSAKIDGLDLTRYQFTGGDIPGDIIITEENNV